MASDSIVCEIQVADAPYPADKDIPVVLSIRNTGSQTIRVGCHTNVFVGIDGLTTSLHWDVMLPETQLHHFHLDKDQSASVEISLPSLLYYLRGSSGVITKKISVRFGFYHEVSEGTYKNRFVDVDMAEPIKFDMSTVTNLPGPEGPSEFFLSERGVLHADRSSTSSREAPISVLKMKARNVRALTGSIVCNDEKMFWRVWPARRPIRGTLRGFNNIFYGDKDGVWTTYGDARIDDPASFEVLGPAEPGGFSHQRAGYQCGYARDNGCAYYFDESNSTKHAIKLRSCKHPESLVSLGSAWAKDEGHIYYEGKRVKGADASTFRLLNFCYARDANGLWFHTRNFLGADHLAKDIRVLPSRWGTLWVNPDPFLTSDKLQVGKDIFDGWRPELEMDGEFEG